MGEVTYQYASTNNRRSWLHRQPTVKYFQKQNEEIIVVDNLQSDHEAAVDVDHLYRIYIRDKEELDKVFKTHNIEAVIHFAANSLVGESLEKPYEYYHNNVYRMLCLLDVMKEQCK